MIAVEGLKKSFGSQQVLNGIDLMMPTGSITIIIGRSGSGKSVLLKHLLGLVRPDAGRVMVDDVDVTELGRRDIDRVRAKYGVVFQGGALFDSMTCEDNVAFPLREKKRRLGEKEIAERVRVSLRQVGLEGMGPKYPDEVSGGMRKRVAIARALVTEPEIVFFDEPTTGLDPILVNTMHRLIKTLHERYHFTVVMVSHDLPEIFDIAEQVAMLHEGRIIEAGPPAAIQGSVNPLVQRFIRGEPETEAQ